MRELIFLFVTNMSTEAMAWLNIPTDGNPLQDPEKNPSINWCLNWRLRRQNSAPRLPSQSKEETRKLRRSYYDELKEEFRLDLSTEVDAKVKQVVAEVKREADARDNRVKREVA